MLFWIFYGVNLLFAINALEHYSQNANSCIDSCYDGFKVKYKINLENGSEENQDSELVEVLERLKPEDSQYTDCSKNVLLRIPFHKLTEGTIAKIELEYGDIARGTTIHIGNSPTNDLNGGDQNTTLYNSEIYSNETDLTYYMSSENLCDQQVPLDGSVDLSRLLFLNESLSFINPKSKIAFFISEKWFRVDNLDRNTTLYFNNNYLFNFKKSKLSEKCEKHSLSDLNQASPYLYIGLNRVILNDKILPGSGLCKAEISFLNCFTNAEPDIDVDVNELKFKLNDSENITWVSPLSYMENSVMEHSPCSGQGVLKLTYDPSNMRRVARFDLEFGEILSGFTFNIGDSPTNNAYGGDTGTTSNSAEIHSNDNRFYVWLNTKYCGDTLLYKIEYNLIQSFDKLTFFISDQRIEVTNHRDFHEILKSPYLYNLNGQNVTCNCFDTRCYKGVNPDYDVYFGINRVIGGTYRPGVGLCSAKISWLRCGGEIKTNSRLVFSDFIDLHSTTDTTNQPETTLEITKTTESITETSSSTTTTIKTTQSTTESTTTTTETTSTIESTSTSTSTTTTTTSTSTITPETVETTTTTVATTTTSVSTTNGIVTSTTEETEEESELETTTINILDFLKNSTLEISKEKVDNDDEDESESDTETDSAKEDDEMDDDLEEDEKTRVFKGRLQKSRPLLIKKNVTMLEEIPNEAIAVKEESENYAKYCTDESIQNKIFYHEHKTDSNKFIYCEQVNRAIILLCPLNMKWSQEYVQCLQSV
ncbi:unnamed protein product [Brachionus calyciflorus]|uniref:Uncharacterized protein n=1 Tax=Brachionus calyciflorus TaxID=104777 RepID=A0A813LWR9_9BILA|nr:unnamed protein product [Brachionus calyciflorus]